LIVKLEPTSELSVSILDSSLELVAICKNFEELEVVATLKVMV